MTMAVEGKMEISEEEDTWPGNIVKRYHSKASHDGALALQRNSPTPLLFHVRHWMLHLSINDFRNNFWDYQKHGGRRRSG